MRKWEVAGNMGKKALAAEPLSAPSRARVNPGVLGVFSREILLLRTKIVTPKMVDRAQPGMGGFPLSAFVKGQGQDAVLG